VGDEHVAAYNVIGCAIERLVRDPRKRVILRHTLNYEGEKFDLDPRRQAAADELFMSTSACEPIEVRAYIDLAALLVNAMTTPCHSRTSRITDREVFEVFEAFKKFRNLLNLQQALSLFARESNRYQRRALAQLILDEFPRGRVHVQRQMGMAKLSYSTQLDVLLGDALRIINRTESTYSRSPWNAHVSTMTFLELLFRPLTKEDIAGGHYSRRPPKYSRTAALHDRLSGDSRLWDRHRNSVTPEFYAFLRESIRVLSESMRDIERREAWEQLFPHRD
jgi:hypothetical protein